MIDGIGKRFATAALLGAALVAVNALPAAAQSAQTGAAAPVAAGAPVDPARLAAAHELIDTLLPPDRREQMIGQMVTPMLANMRRGLDENPEFSALVGSDPRARDAFNRFMDRISARALAELGTEMPALFDAMAIAYARTLDVAQLREVRAFLETPAGHAYTQASISIMNDPDVAKAQRAMIARSMSHMQQDVAEFASEMAAQEKKQ